MLNSKNWTISPYDNFIPEVVMLARRYATDGAEFRSVVMVRNFLCHEQTRTRKKKNEKRTLNKLRCEIISELIDKP